MNTTIHIPHDRLQEGTLQFVRRSALAFCTHGHGDVDPAGVSHADTDLRGDDSIAITSAWPVAGFSIGETAAWNVLQSLVSGELRQLLNTTDADTITALIDALVTVRGLVMS